MSCDIVGFSFSNRQNTGVYIPIHWPDSKDSLFDDYLAKVLELIRPVMENVLIPTLPKKSENTEKNREKALELIKEVDLWDLRDKFPDTLSGGECQRVAVIRALINNPKLILADEPTGSLDHRNALSIVSLLQKLNKDSGTSLIMVTHSSEIGSKMDRHFNLIDGKLVIAG